jgi:hypothetical protein
MQVVLDLPDDTLLWIHRGAIGFMFIMVFLPWMSMGTTAPSGFGPMGDSISVSFMGLNFGGGVLVFLAIVASGILSFLESTKYWSWIGTAVAGLVSFIFAIAPPVSASYSDGYSSASIGAGFGPWLCFLGGIVATAAGLFVFLKYIKNKPLSVPPAA